MSANRKIFVDGSEKILHNDGYLERAVRSFTNPQWLRVAPRDGDEVPEITSGMRVWFDGQNSSHNAPPLPANRKASVLAGFPIYGDAVFQFIGKTNLDAEERSSSKCC